MDLKEKIRTVPHWPIEGVMFRDITTVLQEPEAMKEACNRFYERYKGKNIDKIVGIDARGFIFGSVLAYQLNLGLILVRKKGNCPIKQSVPNIPWSTELIPWRCMRMPFKKEIRC